MSNKFKEVGRSDSALLVCTSTRTIQNVETGQKHEVTVFTGNTDAETERHVGEAISRGEMKPVK